ncbi:MAG: hypothetical protein MZU91_04955 [Desulfosudis oleivorans]|nr:hypothetical protein [Desulfosudis oleivorans]
MAMLAAVECGYQARPHGPHGNLAEQHYITMHRLVEDLGLTVHLLTGSTNRRTSRPSQRAPLTSSSAPMRSSRKG